MHDRCSVFHVSFYLTNICVIKTVKCTCNVRMGNVVCFSAILLRNYIIHKNNLQNILCLLSSKIPEVMQNFLKMTHTVLTLTYNLVISLFSTLSFLRIIKWYNIKYIDLDRWIYGDTAFVFYPHFCS